MLTLPSRRGFAAIAMVLCAVFATLLIAWPRPASAANANVSIAGFAFDPASVTVNVGEKVTWTHNQGSTPHTVTSDSGLFDSGSLTGGGVFEKTFTEAGTFAYHCAIHPSMHGTVIVTGAAAPTATPTSTQPAATNTQAPANTPAATNTPVPAATAAAATAGSTSAPAGSTSAATSGPSPAATAAGSPASSTTPGATATRPTGGASGTTVAVPATGDSGGDGGGSKAPWVIGALVLVVAGAGGGFLLWRRNAA